ncbi:hypothetical protein [Atopomonas sediminilitoris]|uniref:hypothetical protein n=1 Tax=Atopomonas sediminilitoris TaxID=2919919 RepID=UPI001F4DD49A|nr:hypothetical protein [Atopomonas sediminilitoris]MCJ8168456.1 hypothetical protein [Atopomonas sediminilitoris]
MKISGRIGEQVVDLTVSLEPHEWVQLAQAGVQLAPALTAPADLTVTTAPAASMAGVAASAPSADKLLTMALQVLAAHGACDGPTLRGELLALAGSEVAAKRLLVKLRHHPQVTLEEHQAAPVYRWRG